MQREIFITGRAGYMGRALIPSLLRRGHRVRALVRSGSEAMIQAGCEVVRGNALDGQSYQGQVAGCDTFIHLVGVSHPGPSKAREFVAVDLRGGQEAIRVAALAGAVENPTVGVRILGVADIRDSIVLGS